MRSPSSSSSPPSSSSSLGVMLSCFPGKGTPCRPSKVLPLSMVLLGLAVLLPIASMDGVHVYGQVEIAQASGSASSEHRALGNSDGIEGDEVFDDETGLTVKSYSYICMHVTSENLCLGLSPGNDPAYDPEVGMGLQLKPKDSNEEKHLDYKKLRWDVDISKGTINLSNYTDLCLGIGRKNDYKFGIVLEKCYNHENATHNWQVEFAGVKDYSGAVVIRQRGTNRCATVKECKVRDDEVHSCDTGGVANGEDIGFLRGAWVEMNGCFDLLDIPEYRNAQLFSVHLDCAPGCSEDLLGDGVCEKYCNNERCLWDHLDCNKDLNGNPIPTTPGATPYPTMPTIPPAATADGSDDDDNNGEAADKDNDKDNNDDGRSEYEGGDGGTNGDDNDGNGDGNGSDVHTWFWWLLLLLLIILIIIVAYRRRERRRREAQMEAIGDDDDLFGSGQNGRPETGHAPKSVISRASNGRRKGSDGAGPQNGHTGYEEVDLDAPFGEERRDLSMI